MTKELAELLDGPVADRFGRPKKPTGETLRTTTASGINAKYYWSGGAASKRGRIDMCSVFAAEQAWLAHLIGVCGERKWIIAIIPPCESLGHPMEFRVDLYSVFPMRQLAATITHSPLDALATSMLSVPEVKP